MKLKLKNGAELEVLCVNGSNRYFQGAQRDTLEIQIKKEQNSFEEIDSLFSNKENISRIQLINNDEVYAHDNYSLRIEMSLKPVVIKSATSSELEVTEERICVVLAQKTYSETQQEQLQETVDQLILSSLGV